MQIEELGIGGHETVLRVTDAGAGLHGIIAVHSTARGPAAGGLRMKPYPDEAAAIEDALRLSRGMSLKNAAADLPLGGGKAVILGDPAGKTEALLRAMGRAVDTLGGRYWTAEDMGMSPADMDVVAAETRFVAGRADGAHASGDPSPITADGVARAARIVAARAWGGGFAGRRALVQGAGHVGAHLARHLAAAGAEVIVADRDPDRARDTARQIGARAVPAEEILGLEGDLLAPCAVGAVLSAGTIPALRVRAICGAANNQLARDADADRLRARRILYAPDYVVNAGGIVNVATEILGIADRAGFVAAKLCALEATLTEILDRAEREGTSPARVADAIALERIRPAAG